MKIMLVHNAYQERGGEDIVFEQERALLRDAGHEVLEYVRSNDEIKAPSGPQQIKIAINTIWASGVKSAFGRMLAQDRPDLVHVHNTFVMISPAIYWACMEAAVPVVQTLHNYRLLCPAGSLSRNSKPCEECVERGPWRGMRYGCYRGSRSATAVVALMLEVHRYRRTWTDAVDCFIALTHFARDKFIGAGLPAAKICVKPNFVDQDPGRGTRDGEYAIFAGRLSPEKGVKTLLSAWKRLNRRIPLKIVGDGPSRIEMQQTAAAHPECNVEFEGRLTRERMLKIIKAARFLIFPSELYESFGLTIIEAYACGVPVIASRLGAMQELVADQRTGILFRAGDADDLAEKVLWAWDHSAEMNALAANARAEYESRYTAEQNLRLMTRIYEEVIARRSRTAGDPYSERLDEIAA